MLEWEAVRATLLQSAAVVGFVQAGQAARIYPVKLPQRPTLPAITYQRVSGPRTESLDGPTGLARARIQIDCWAQDAADTSGYVSAKSLADAVRLALGGNRSAPGQVPVLRSHLANERDGYEDAVDAYRVTLDFVIYYVEAVR